MVWGDFFNHALDSWAQPTLCTAIGTCCLLQMDHKWHTQPCRAGTQRLASRLPARLCFGGDGTLLFHRERGERPPCALAASPQNSSLQSPSPFQGGSRRAASGDASALSSL